jgi:DNA-binding response OmpR family regulator
MTIRNAQIVEAARGPSEKRAGGAHFLGERSSDPDGTERLELGAKACVIMCSPRELADRIQMMLRHAKAVPSEPEEALESGELKMWHGKRRVEWRGEAVKLTSTEFTLLELLLRHRGRPVSKMELSLHALRRPLARFDRSVDVHMSNLRRKLAEYAKDRRVIQSVYPYQYQLLMENSAS